MPTSLNLRFDASELRDLDSSEIGGETLMRWLRDAVVREDENASDVELWRDSGWEFRIEAGHARMSLVLAVLDGEWLLQVGPHQTAGFIGWLCGQKSSASVQDVYEMASRVHLGLKEYPGFANPKWCWDGFPGHDGGSEVPECEKDGYSRMSAKN